MAIRTTSQTKLSSSPAMFFLDYPFPLAILHADGVVLVNFILNAYEPGISKGGWTQGKKNIGLVILCQPFRSSLNSAKLQTKISHYK